jgi:hypothetical protein
MLLKNASSTKYERLSLAMTVLEMPTASIVKSLEPLTAINWNDARPWIAMLGAVILFLGWELRKKRREIQKLDLEIAQMRSQQSLVRVATIHEMNSLIKDVEEISARKVGILGGTSPLEGFGIRFREVLVLRSAHFGDSHARANMIQQKLADVMRGSRPREDGKEPWDEQPDPLPLYNEWKSVRHLATSKLSTETIDNIDFLSRFLMIGTGKRANTETFVGGLPRVKLFATSQRLSVPVGCHLRRKVVGFVGSHEAVNRRVVRVGRSLEEICSVL